MPIDDPLDEQLHSLIDMAVANKEFALAALLQSIAPIRLMGRNDLMSRFAETAVRFSGLATGRLNEESALRESTKLDLPDELKSLGDVAAQSGDRLDKVTAAALAALAAIHMRKDHDRLREVAVFASKKSLEATGQDAGGSL